MRDPAQAFDFAAGKQAVAGQIAFIAADHHIAADKPLHRFGEGSGIAGEFLRQVFARRVDAGRTAAATCPKGKVDRQANRGFHQSARFEILGSGLADQAVGPARPDAMAVDPERLAFDPAGAAARGEASILSRSCQRSKLLPRASRTRPN